MLILSRNVGQTITIGDSIKVIIKNVNGGQVKIGIEAPKNIAVHRQEIYDKINAESKRVA